ncbi:lamin tail domain-containing protein [bacterium]|nr:lamin tail domain-containing protein [bacterium]
MNYFFKQKNKNPKEKNLKKEKTKQIKKSNFIFILFLFIIMSFLFFFFSFTKCLASQEKTKGWQGIIIQEIFPNPEDKDFNKEWIKIYNSSNKEINLKNWLLIDSFGNNTPFVFLNDLWLEDDDYLILERKETNIILNNFKEVLSIFTPDGELADQISYENAPENKIYSFKKEDDYFSWIEKNENKNITNNTNTNNNQEETTEIISLKNNWFSLEKDKKAMLEGIVLTLPGQNSSQYFFLTSDKNQSEIIQIYNYKKEFPDIKTGDKLKISGTISEISNWKRLKTNSLDNFISLNENEKIIIPELKNNLKKENLGKIFSIEGKIEKINKNNLKINYNNETFLVETSLMDTSFEKDSIIKINVQLLFSNNEYYLKILPNYNLISKKDNKKIFSLLFFSKFKNKNILIPFFSILLFVCIFFYLFFSIKTKNKFKMDLKMKNKLN